jgi:hypothetical protein
MRYIALVPILAITACTTPEQESPATAAPVPIELNCAAESVQYAIGQQNGHRKWIKSAALATATLRRDDGLPAGPAQHCL